MLNKFKKIVYEEKLILPKEKIIVGVSGGSDSVCLLDLISKIQKTYKNKIIVAHLNHSLRNESKKDEGFVKNLAQKYGYLFVSVENDVSSFQKKNKLSLEEASRKLRYTFFKDQTIKFNTKKIILAHHKDDQAETVILNFLRGASLRGLAGMQENDYLKINKVRLNLIRPLLNFSKKEILSYCKTNKLKYVFDKSNDDLSFSRNKIRAKLLPLLEKEYNSNLKETIFKNAKNILELENYISTKSKNYIQKIIITKDESIIKVDLKRWLKIDDALKPFVFMNLMTKLGKNSFDSKNITRAIDFIKNGKTGKKIELMAELKVYKDYDKFIISAGKLKQKIIKQKLKLKIPGTTFIKDVNKKIKASFVNKKGKNFSQVAFLDYKKLDSKKIFVRSRKEGDWFIPYGLNSKKKIKDFFINEKVSKIERSSIPLVAVSNNRVIWVAGLRIDNEFKANINSKKVLKLELLKGETNER